MTRELLRWAENSNSKGKTKVQGIIYLFHHLINWLFSKKKIRTRAIFSHWCRPIQGYQILGIASYTSLYGLSNCIIPLGFKKSRRGCRAKRYIMWTLISHASPLSQILRTSATKMELCGAISLHAYILERSVPDSYLICMYAKHGMLAIAAQVLECPLVQDIAM